jgi:hypothetical protein
MSRLKYDQIPIWENTVCKKSQTSTLTPKPSRALDLIGARGQTVQFQAEEMNEPSKRCANCNTQRDSIYCKGYCKRCYRLIVRKQLVERWDLKDPSTLKGLPSIAETNVIEFSEIKAKTLKELEVRLWLLKTREAQRTAKITRLDIEIALERLADWCGGYDVVYRQRQNANASDPNFRERQQGPKRDSKYRERRNVMHGIASEVNYYFSQKQKQVLLGWLFDIEESMRWNPRRYRHLLKHED